MSLRIRSKLNLLLKILYCILTFFSEFVWRRRDEAELVGGAGEGDE